MTLISSLEDDAKEVGAAVKGVFTTIEGELESFLSKGAAAIATTIKAQVPGITLAGMKFLESSAIAAVTAAAAVPGGGQVKMAAALTSFTASIAGEGITLAETEMRSLLENALLVSKTSATTAAPATVAAGSAGA